MDSPGNVPHMPRSERLANTVFGLNVLVWAILGVLSSPPPERWHAVRLCIAGLHVTVGILLLRRHPLLRSGQFRQLLQAVPGIVLSGFAFRLAPPCHQWQSTATCLFATGTVIAIAALISLAQNFAILPAVRGVTIRGLYRFVRHPVYTGEMFMVLACVVAGPGIEAIAIFTATLMAVVLRIRTEESMLRQSGTPTGETYRAYCDVVPARLIPRIW